MRVGDFPEKIKKIFLRNLSKQRSKRNRILSKVTEETILIRHRSIWLATIIDRDRINKKYFFAFASINQNLLVCFFYKSRSDWQLRSLDWPIKVSDTNSSIVFSFCWRNVPLPLILARLASYSASIVCTLSTICAYFKVEKSIMDDDEESKI